MYRLLDISDFLRLYPNFNTKLSDGSKLEKEDALELMYETMNIFGINTKNRQAFFFAQSGHETQGFFRYEEILRYSYARLLVVFKGKFTLEEARKAAMNPEIIANTVYSNRFGNGSYDSGDGYKYRGRGMIQTTFKDNYKQLNNEDERLSHNYFEQPDLMGYFIGALESACHFWHTKNLNASADAQRLDINTRIINCGLNGYPERQRELGRIFQLAK